MTQRSIGGSRLFVSDTTSPDSSSGVNIHREEMAKPCPAITAARTPSAAVNLTDPRKRTALCERLRRNDHFSPPEFCPYMIAACSRGSPRRAVRLCELARTRGRVGERGPIIYRDVAFRPARPASRIASAFPTCRNGSIGKTSSPGWSARRRRTTTDRSAVPGYPTS
jgi:hypothetical protein